MKKSIRKKFTLGVVFFLAIILLLSVLSAYYLNMLSGKTNAILKENHYSVVYARDMSEALTNINQEIINYSFAGKTLDSSIISKELKQFDQSLTLEKSNITETGEDKLAADIETGFKGYRDSVKKIMNSTKKIAEVVYLENKFGSLYHQLMLLSQMNEKAIEIKTSDTKASAKKASLQMTIVATLCFLIAFGFTFSFGSYFSERFFQLYNGIKEIASSNYGHRLYFKGQDEFYEISLVFNEMAEKLSGPNPKKPLILDDLVLEKDQNLNDTQELKRLLSSMKTIEEQAGDLISKLENKK